MGVTMLTTRELDAVESELNRMMAGAGDTGGMSVLETADYAVRTSWRLLLEYRELKKYFAIYNDSAARIAG